MNIVANKINPVRIPAMCRTNFHFASKPMARIILKPPIILKCPVSDTKYSLYKSVTIGIAIRIMAAQSVALNPFYW